MNKGKQLQQVEIDYSIINCLVIWCINRIESCALQKE